MHLLRVPAHAWNSLAAWCGRHKLLITICICAVIFLLPFAYMLAGAGGSITFLELSTVLIIVPGIVNADESRTVLRKPLASAAFNLWMLLGLGHFLLGLGLLLSYEMPERYNGLGSVALMLAVGCAGGMIDQFGRLFTPKPTKATVPQ